MFCTEEFKCNIVFDLPSFQIQPSDPPDDSALFIYFFAGMERVSKI